MARRRGMASLVNAIARDMARAQRQAEAERKRQIRAAEAERKALERQRKQAEIEERRQQAQSERERKRLEKEAQQQYLANRLQETKDRNTETAEYIQALHTVLELTSTVNDSPLARCGASIKYASFHIPKN